MTPEHASMSDETPDFVDVHVTLDWVIRVHGQSDAEAAKDIATDYIADQSLQSLVEMVVHEDGVLCDGEDLTSKTDERGYLDESELTIALYPEDQELPTNVDVAVSTYDPRGSEGIDPARYAAEAGTADHG